MKKKSGLEPDIYKALPSSALTTGPFNSVNYLLIWKRNENVDEIFPRYVGAMNSNLQSGFLYQVKFSKYNNTFFFPRKSLVYLKMFNN